MAQIQSYIEIIKTEDSELLRKNIKKLIKELKDEDKEANFEIEEVKKSFKVYKRILSGKAQ